jgi:hypothetical protein
VTRTSTGVCRGASVHFANVNPKAGKRADYIATRPDTARSYAYFNECPGGSGTDPNDDGNGGDQDPPTPGTELPGGGGDDENWDDDSEDRPSKFTGDLVTCNSYYKTLDDVVEHQDEIPPACMAGYLVSAMADLMDDTLERYYDLKDDYEGKFEYYRKFVVE